MAENVPLKEVQGPSAPVVLAFGNPLLDISVTLESDTILQKYGLKVDGEVELPQDKIQELLADLPPEVEQRISPGGCAQNTMRIMQWLCGGKNAPTVGTFCGGLGKDARGETLERMVQAEKVNTKYAIHPTLPTGVCISMISGSSRSLVANIGAAGVYTFTDLRRSNLPLDGVKIIYIEGFFVVHSRDVANEIVELTKDKNVIVAFNLSGEYIFEEHHDAICEMVGLAKIVFGNAREMMALANVLEIKYRCATHIPFLLNSSKRVAVSVANVACPSTEWLTNNDIFVMTQGGSAPAIVVWGQGHSIQVNPFTPKAPIVDTTGAGDSVVAGFLTGVLAQWGPKTCLEYGCKAAAMMITRIGVTLPESVPEELTWVPEERTT